MDELPKHQMPRPMAPNHIQSCPLPQRIGYMVMLIKRAVEMGEPEPVDTAVHQFGVIAGKTMLWGQTDNDPEYEYQGDEDNAN